MSVVITDPPRRRRTGRFIAIAVVVAAAVAGGVAFAVTSADDAATYSLTAASNSTDEVKTMRFTTTTKGFGTEVVADIETDVENGLLHMNMDLGTNAIGFGGDMEMIVDLENEMTYINGSFFEALGIPIESEWLGMDAEWLAETGQDTVFNVDAVGDPLDAAVAVEDAIKTEEIGFAEVGGIKVKHYRVTFKTDDVFADNEQLQTQIDDLNGELPDEIVYEFYVDEQNRVRRVTYQMDIGSGELSTDIEIVSINEPLDIDIPDPDDVTDARDFL